MFADGGLIGVCRTDTRHDSAFRALVTDGGCSRDVIVRYGDCYQSMYAVA